MKRLLALALLLLTPSLAYADDEFPDFDELVEEHKVHEGFFRLYTKEKEEVLLAAIPEERLEAPFFLATSVSGGSEEIRHPKPPMACSWA